MYFAAGVFWDLGASVYCVLCIMRRILSGLVYCVLCMARKAAFTADSVNSHLWYHCAFWARLCIVYCVLCIARRILGALVYCVLCIVYCAPHFGRACVLCIVY